MIRKEQLFFIEFKGEQAYNLISLMSQASSHDLQPSPWMKILLDLFLQHKPTFNGPPNPLACV